MKSWRTTLAGVISIGSLVVSTFFPEYTPFANKVITIAIAAGLIAARDNKVSSEQAGIFQPSKSP